MQKIMLKQLSLDMGKPEYEMFQRIPAVENGFTNPAYNLSYDEYKEWLQITDKALLKFAVDKHSFWFYYIYRTFVCF